MEDLTKFLSNPEKYAFLISQSPACALAAYCILNRIQIEGVADVALVSPVLLDYVADLDLAPEIRFTLHDLVELAELLTDALPAVQQQYKYIVVGGGATGARVAAQLPPARTLLLDMNAGQHALCWDTGTSKSVLPVRPDFKCQLHARRVSTPIQGKRERVTRVRLHTVTTDTHTYWGEHIVLCCAFAPRTSVSQYYYSHIVMKGATTVRDGLGFLIREPTRYAAVYIELGEAIADIWLCTSEDPVLEEHCRKVMAQLCRSFSESSPERVVGAHTFSDLYIRSALTTNLPPLDVSPLVLAKERAARLVSVLV